MRVTNFTEKQVGLVVITTNTNKANLNHVTERAYPHMLYIVRESDLEDSKLKAISDHIKTLLDE